jgi:hypothetical protein
MIFGAPIRDQRVTMPCFRNCSTCTSRSKPPLCHCTQKLVSDQPEGSFGRLRYFLGGDRPSQTAHQAVSPTRVHSSRLDSQNIQGGISTVTPPNPEARFQRLPPILRRMSRKSLPSCSKGSWGLSVLPRVEGIFTPWTISLSPWSRQRGCCYAIRAGRNLPDKEFRYLRTVIVTAGVHQRFSSKLPPEGFTSPLNVLTLARHQPLYFSLRFRRDLCFW